MKTLYGDLLGISVFILIVFSLWISASAYADIVSLGLILFMLTSLFLANIYFIYKREMHSLVERIIYVYSFMIFSSVIIALLIIDDYPIMSGIYYLMASASVITILTIVTLKWSYFNKFTFRKQNLIMWTISIICVFIGFLTLV